MISTLLGIYITGVTGVNIGTGLYYSKIAKSFSFDKMLESYQDDLNKSTKTLSLVEPNFTDKEIIKPFYQILKENVTEEELILVTNRLEKIKVKKGLFSLTQGGHFNNALSYIKYYDYASLMHEFLHMASSYYDKKRGIYLCGFESLYKFLRIGRGITEGFTELFASRFENRDPRSYKPIVEICKLLEMLFDEKDDARKLYFHSDFPTFVRKLQEYMSMTEVFNLIVAVDNLTKTYDDKMAYKIRVFIYKKFLDKCDNQEKLEEMINVISENDALTIFDDVKKDDVDSLFKSGNSKKYFRDKAKKKLGKSAATIAICTSILLVNNTFGSNDLKSAQNLVAAHKTDSCSVLLNEDYFLSNELDGIDGRKLYRTLVSEDVKYFEVNGDYYTKDGGILTVEEYKITLHEYVKDAIPLYHNGKFVCYMAGDGLDKEETTEIKDGKVYQTSYVTYKQVILPDGTIVNSLDDFVKDIMCEYKIDFINSLSVESKSYEDLKDLNLVFDNENNEDTKRFSGKSK